MVANYSQGSAAYLNYTSVPVVHSSKSCLSFWYYMYAGPVGRLALYVTTDGSVRRRVWDRQVGHGGSAINRRWLQGEVEFSDDITTLTEVDARSLLTAVNCCNCELYS